MGWGDSDYGPGENPAGGAWGFGGLEDPNVMVGGGFFPQQAGPSGKGGYWDSIANFLKPAATTMLPILGGAAAQLGVAGAANAMFPGQQPGIRSIDPRTAAGATAEDTRLRAAQGLGNRFQTLLTGGPYAGGMSPQEMATEEDLVRRAARNADAARGLSGGGGLETGGGAVREQEAVSKFRRGQREVTNQEIARAAQGMQGLTSGFGSFHPMTSFQTPGRSNPWANIITSTLAPSLGKGVESVLAKYMV